MKPWRTNAPDGLDRDQGQDGKMISMQNNILSFTATRPDFVLAAPSGLNLTFESLKGFPPVSPHASLADANRNFHHSQVR